MPETDLKQRREVRALEKYLDGTGEATGLIGQSEGMRELHRLVGLVASSDANALITGESGTGKEVVARAVHSLSTRRGQSSRAMGQLKLAKSMSVSGAGTGADTQARQFINDPSRNRFDKASGTAALSEIFKWFEEDFRGAGSLQKYLAKYADDPEVARMLAADGFRIEWMTYDWSLNGTPPRR